MKFIYNPTQKKIKNNYKSLYSKETSIKDEIKKKKNLKLCY
jgi:hypothetical protein